MNMTSLIAGFILGVVSTFIFTSALKLSAGKVSGEKLTMIKSLKANSLLGVLILVPILAGLIYWKVGSPDVPSSSVGEPTKTMSSPVAMGANSDSHEMGDL